MAIVWSNQPAAEDVVRNFCFVKAQPKKVLRCRILSHDLAVCRLHYWRRRSRGCTDEGCLACAAGNPWRWTGFLLVVLPGETRMKILQVPGFVADQLHGERCRRATLKNLEIELTRKGEQTNSEVFMKVGRQGEGYQYNPRAPELPPILARIWEVKIADQVELPIVASLKLAATGTEGKK